MKVVIKNTDGIDPRHGFCIGQEIEVVGESSYSKEYLCINSLDIIPKICIESPIDRLSRLAKTASKMLISIPTKGYTVDVVQGDNYLVVYSHSKGNHWNISGNHYKYYHDVNTGEFLGSDHNVLPEKGKWKERLLKSVAQKIAKINKEKLA